MKFINWTLRVVICLMAVLLIHGFQLNTVVGKSMLPTVDEGVVISAKAVDIPRDVVGLFRIGDITLIKRVIAKGGDVVKFKSGDIYVNGEQTRYTVKGMEDQEITIMEDHLYILGDNVDVSFDSHLFGEVYINTLEGVLLYEGSLDFISDYISDKLKGVQAWSHLNLRLP